MVGNFAERKYQLAAQKRSQAELKFDYYNQTAKYFERECNKAKQFNNWKIENIKSTYQDNIRKAQELQSRQNRLRELLIAEEEEYNRQFSEIKKEKKLPRVEVTLEELKNQLIEKRSERSLYTPKVNRRIQSYFCYPTTHISRSPLKELNNSPTIKSPRMSLENTNLRDEPQYSNESSGMPKESVVDYSHVREDFDERASAAKENRANSLTSNFGNDYNPHDVHYSSISSRPLSKRQSNVVYGHQKVLHENDEFNESNEKFAKQYERESLENKNNADDSINNDMKSLNVHDKQEDIDETDEVRYVRTPDPTENGSNDSQNKFNGSDDGINGISAGLNIKNDDDSTGPLTWNDKNLTELMYLYLTHNDIKRKIADLEVREKRASNKGLWDDALRLRDMKNRLELMREKEIYQRDDLYIDPESRKSVVENITWRMHQLEDREKSCTDSKIYSEDAKLMWNKWVEEDAKTFITDGTNQREILLQKLEEEWRKLAEHDKQRLTHTYNNVMMGSSLQNELKVIAEKISG